MSQKLGQNKVTLLAQVQKQPNIDVAQLIKLIQTYDDLDIYDFKGYVSDLIYNDLLTQSRDPQELASWNNIKNAPTSTPEEIQNVQRQIASYIQHFPTSPSIDEANRMMNDLQLALNEAIRKSQEAEAAKREQNDWDRLERGNYTALLTYRSKYPESIHLSEIDDLCWKNTKAVINVHTLNRYLNDWPLGIHAQEASEALSTIGEWERVKRTGDLFVVDDYRDSNPSSPFKNEIDSVYYTLCDKELQKMKDNPSEYSKDDVEKLLAADIFSQWQLMDEGLITEESWETLLLDRDLFPNIQEFQVEDANIQAPKDCTDVYLFGTPGTGKTCLLMGLTGANGKMYKKPEAPNRSISYTLNMKSAGGPYASALQQYVNAGITPGRTFGKFVTTINGQINEKDNKGNVLSHKINLVEMSGEEFALRIADGKEVSLSNMGTGATNLLSNNNKKVFFIIVDSTKDMVKVEYVEQVKDAEGNIIDERIRKKYISQLDILNKFVSLFTLEENAEIMKKVDAIHFVVTKADYLGSANERKLKARDLLLSKYTGPVEMLKTYCDETKRINYSTKYRPQVFTFSLGKFYLGDVFSFDPSETLQIVNTISTVTGAIRPKTFLDRLRETLG